MVQRLPEDFPYGAIPLVHVNPGDTSYVLVEDLSVRIREHTKRERVIAPMLRGQQAELEALVMSKVREADGELEFRILMGGVHYPNPPPSRPWGNLPPFDITAAYIAVMTPEALFDPAPTPVVRRTLFERLLEEPRY